MVYMPIFQLKGVNRFSEQKKKFFFFAYFVWPSNFFPILLRSVRKYGFYRLARIAEHNRHKGRAVVAFASGLVCLLYIPEAKGNRHGAHSFSSVTYKAQAETRPRGAVTRTHGVHAEKKKKKNQLLTAPAAMLAYPWYVCDVHTLYINILHTIPPQQCNLKKKCALM